ncbi:IncQ-type mobilization protein MobB [Janthinobacterium sp. EB271-G4-3-1]|uniref:IncQ-type mobilization protein MobB n=2 Tax=unclassified Janthinobacterium TaxID=2610881 RepID=UPI0034DD15E2
MTKSETLRQLATAENTAQLDALACRMAQLHQARLASAEELAALLEPLAQAMAALTDEARQTMQQLGLDGTRQGEQFRRQIEAATSAWRSAEQAARESAQTIDCSSRTLSQRQYLLAALVGMMTGLLASALWLCLAPAPRLQNVLDA